MASTSKCCVQRVCSRSLALGLRYWLATLILASLIFVSPRLVSAQEGYCPASISVKQAIEKAPEGWTAGQDKTPHNLSGITFYDGLPSKRPAWSTIAGRSATAWRTGCRILLPTHLPSHG